MKQIDFKDNLIIIGPSYMKKNILKECGLNYNIKYINIEELIQKYLHSYKNDTLIYLDSKYNHIPEISEKILKSLYFIDEEKNYKNKKLDFLVEIKKDLINNGYIINDNNFKNYLHNKEILVIDDEYDKQINKIINLLKQDNTVELIKFNDQNKEFVNIVEFDNLEDEVIFVADSIYDLVSRGISLDKIKINSLDSAYKASINRVFNFYNIPFDNDSEIMYYLNDVKLFLNSINMDMLLTDINDVIGEIKINNIVKEKLVDIINNFTSYEYVKDIYNELIYALENTSIKINKYKNIISEIDYKNYLPEDDEYIFILGLNQDILPVIHKDNSYLSDKELLLLSSDTSFDKNLIEKNKLFNFINNTKNLIISYKLNSSTNTFKPSNFIEELKSSIAVNIRHYDYSYKNDELNKIRLASNIDNYIKYNNINDDNDRLYSKYYDIPYLTYDNNYKKIDYDIIKKQLDNKINLSTTNTNTFFRCQFRFLLDNIYKLNTYEETVSQRIGNLFHDVLCTVYKDKRTDYDCIIDDAVCRMYDNPSKKDLFYIKKYKKALNRLISLLNNCLTRTNYDNTYFEEWFSIDKTDDLEVKIVGKIDKIMTLKDEDKTYVIVIDYKTGSLHKDFNKVIYGFDMQLLYYLYLIKNTSKIKNPFFTGMYLQSIMSDVLSSKDNKKYDDLINENMKLDGYTTNNTSLLYNIDNEYQDNCFVKSLKLKNDGEFYSYSKVLNDEVINELIEIVDRNINEVIHCIKESDFQINPKKIGDDFIGCEYCTYKDICYMNNNNIINLKPYKDLEFLGGDNNDSN